MLPLITAETVSLVTALLGALGVGGIGAKLVDGWIASRSGKHDRETARVQRIMDDRDAAEERARVEARRARIVTEYAHRLRLTITAAGLDPEPFPDLDPEPKEKPDD